MTNDEINERIMRLLGWQKIDVPAWQSPAWQRPTENGTECWYGEGPINYVEGSEFDAIMRILAGNNTTLQIDVTYQRETDSLRYVSRVTSVRHMDIGICEADTIYSAVCQTFIAWRKWAEWFCKQATK